MRAVDVNSSACLSVLAFPFLRADLVAPFDVNYTSDSILKPCIGCSSNVADMMPNISDQYGDNEVADFKYSTITTQQSCYKHDLVVKVGCRNFTRDVDERVLA